MNDVDHTAWVAVGSNIAPETNVPAALTRLARHVAVAAVSTVYRTPPIDRGDQADYVNGVWEIRTATAPRALKFDVLRAVESALGRTRSADPYAARTIDLDLILYDRLVIAEPDLVLPDPDIGARAFVAVPLWELAGEMVLPDTGESLTAIVRRLSTESMTADEALTARLRALIGEA